VRLTGSGCNSAPGGGPYRGEQFAANVLPIVRAIQASGLTTLRDIAAALNARGIRTARGGQWHSSTVHKSSRPLR